MSPKDKKNARSKTVTEKKNTHGKSASEKKSAAVKKAAIDKKSAAEKRPVPEKKAAPEKTALPEIDFAAELKAAKKSIYINRELSGLELPEGMTFESHKTDKNCFYEFNKLRVENTMFATELAKNHTDINVGIPFDIFCHDKSANSALGRKIHFAMTIFTRALVLNKWNHRKVDNGSRVQSAVTNFFVKIFPGMLKAVQLFPL